LGLLVLVYLWTQGTHFEAFEKLSWFSGMAFFAVGLYWYGKQHLLDFSMNGLWKQFYLGAGDSALFLRGGVVWFFVTLLLIVFRMFTATERSEGAVRVFCCASFQEDRYCVAFFEGTAFLLIECMRGFLLD